MKLMRYIGSKEKVIPFIHKVVSDELGDINNAAFADLFAGTVSVSKYFKRKYPNLKIITNDYMNFSFAFQVATIKNNTKPSFDKFEKIFLEDSYLEALNYLNNIEGEKGFFYKHYSYEGS